MPANYFLHKGTPWKIKVSMNNDEWCKHFTVGKDVKSAKVDIICPQNDKSQEKQVKLT